MKISQSGEVKTKFQWKNDKLEVYLFIREDVSLDSKYLLAIRLLFVSSMAEFSLSNTLWSLGRDFAIALDLIFLPWLVSNSFWFESFVKGIIFSKHFMQHHSALLLWMCL